MVNLIIAKFLSVLKQTWLHFVCMPLCLFSNYSLYYYHRVMVNKAREQIIGVPCGVRNIGGKSFWISDREREQRCVTTGVTWRRSAVRKVATRRATATQLHRSLSVGRGEVCEWVRQKPPPYPNNNSSILSGNFHCSVRSTTEGCILYIAYRRL